MRSVISLAGLVVGLARVAAVVALAMGPAQPVAAQGAVNDFMSEPDPFTDVLDAFDGQGLFDVRVGLGFRSRVETTTLQREVSDGAGAPERVDIAASTRVTKTLHLGVEVGIFQDLAVSFGLPFVLEDQHRLSLPEAVGNTGGGRAAVEAALQEPLPEAFLPRDGTAAIFDLGTGVRSRLRDGIPHLELGFAWSPVNQYRVPGWPTWTLRWDQRFGTSATMEPCLDGGACARGTSRGTWRSEWSSRWSYRYRLVEPLLGVSHAIELPMSAQDRFEPAGELAGDVDSTPPSVTTVTTGAALIPWEDRAMHQRLRFALIGTASYISAGRDYGPLFDALGTSKHPYLTEPNPLSSGTDGGVAFTGLTHVAAHMRLGMQLEVLMQAARYVRFKAGIGLAHVTPHWLTGEARCDAQASGPEAGCAQGRPNPSYRAAIDAPGRRFRQDTGLVVDLYVGAAGQF